MNKTTHTGTISLYEQRIIILALLMCFLNEGKEEGVAMSLEQVEAAYDSMADGIRQATYYILEFLNNNDNSYIDYLDKLTQDTKVLISKTN